MKEFLNITVLLGGPSAEREVSLRTGTAVAAALRERGHTVHEVDPKTPGWTLPTGTEAVFLALHGTYGEDGTVQRELEALGMPYTGCDPASSETAFDKARTREACAAAGVPVARGLVVNAADTPWPRGWTPPVVVKPVRQGSSVGLQFVDKVDEWRAALAESLRFDSCVLVEERIAGRETTVGILDGAVLPVVEVCPRKGSYDYHNKYTKGATEYFCPAEFSADVTAKIQQAALGAFRAIGGRDYARVDVMVRADGSPVVLEVNTLPGMTETSLLPKAAQAAGIGYGELCERMVRLALRREGVSTQRREEAKGGERPT
jgi:D-alanine-D-alanine ligase